MIQQLDGVGTEPGEKFLPAFFVEVVNEGAVFPFASLPLHITLFPPIKSAYSQTHRDAIREVVHPQPAFEVTTGNTALFGPENTVPVRLLESSVALRSLHEALTSVLARTLHDPTCRQPYNPHITVDDYEQMPKGRTIVIGGLSIVKSFIDGWHIAEKVRLKGDDETAA